MAAGSAGNPGAVELRTVGIDDGPADAAAIAWMRAQTAAFLAPRLEPEVLARAAETFAGHRLRGAYAADDPAPLATLRSWDVPMTVPGGSVTADAVTGIGVRSTHRRRGLLRRLLVDELRGAVRAGTPVAVLTSTQGSLYERFGFGLATWTRGIVVDTRQARFRDPEVRGTVELVDRPEALEALAGPAHERARRRHPGSFGRQPGTWRSLATGAAAWSGMEPDRQRRAAVWRDDDDRVAGHVIFRVETGWYATGAATLAVVDLHATTPQAYLELWRHLCSMDLVGTVRWDEASVDEVLPWLLVDARAVTIGAQRDMLWVRVLDVPGLLAARRYPVEDALVIEVRDPDGLADGRWRVDTADRIAPAVTATADAPDVVVPVTALGSLVLGGVDPRVLARAGRVDEESAGAAGRLARLLAAPSAPWNGTRF